MFFIVIVFSLQVFVGIGKTETGLRLACRLLGWSCRLLELAVIFPPLLTAHSRHTLRVTYLHQGVPSKTHLYHTPAKTRLVSPFILISVRHPLLLPQTYHSR